MTNDPKISSKDLVKFLLSIGYVYDHQHGSHIILHKNHKRALSVPVRKEIGKGLLLRILNEVEYTKNDLAIIYLLPLTCTAPTNQKDHDLCCCITTPSL